MQPEYLPRTTFCAPPSVEFAKENIQSPKSKQAALHPRAMFAQ